MNLENKTILLVSPQTWGNMFLAKHHYAIELARAGNKVFFLNPPQEKKITGGIQIAISNDIPNLNIISHNLFFSYKIKFKWLGLFHFLMKFQIKKIVKKISNKIDIVWSFDLGNYYPFKFFDANAYKIFHPVDEPLTKEAIQSAVGADIIFSVTNEILDKYKAFNIPSYFIHHGLAQEFLQNKKIKKIDTITRVGLSGNWLRPDVDHNTVLKIIIENPNVIFNFWGSYEAKQSNIGGSTNDVIDKFLLKLKTCTNVILHGVVNTEVLANEFRLMDAFLICYDIEKDQSKGTNYHKVMEYLSTGKVIISNNISTYASTPDLVQMSVNRKDNNELLGLFKKVIENVEFYNETKYRELRISFAHTNTYQRNLEKIKNIISIH